VSLQHDTVAIPFTSGIQPATRARLLQPQKLLTAQNCFFFQDQGPQKRFGHVSHTVRTSGNYVGLGGIVPPAGRTPRENFNPADPGLAASWLYGWGIYGTGHTDTSDPFNVSPQPNVGQLFGVAGRDSEILAWDGHRLFSYAPNQSSKMGELQTGTTSSTARGPSCMPALRSQTLAKISDSQKSPDSSDNGILRVVAWLNSDGITAGYSVYDSNNRACLVSNATLTFQGPVYLRCISVGNWFHILVADPTANSLEMRSFHQEQPTTIVSRSLGTVNNQFDAKKIDETKFAVIKSKAGVISAFVLNSDGTTFTTFTPFLNGKAATDNFAIALEVDKGQNLGIVWQTTGAPITVSFVLYTFAGAIASAVTTVATVAANRRMTLSPRYVGSFWDVYIEDVVSTVAQVRCYAVVPGGASTLITTRHRMVLSSHAFRVGNRSFVWCGSWLTGSATALQRTFFLCDAALLPVGKMDYGTANVDISTTTLTLPGVNWRGLAPYKDRIVFHGCLPYNTRVPITPNTVSIGNTGVQAAPSSVFTESSIRFYELDFLPKMRAAQAGRCTYFAGAQLWACDGAENVEAAFHMAPEGVTGAASGGGGSLSAGTYRYRIDLCHKNLQNEEVRSWSIITNGITTGASDKVTLTIPVMPMTRREDSYFLIYRTAVNGTVFYLVNSRDPLSAQFLRNNQATATFTYQDSLVDTTLTTGEYHPANSLGAYVDPLPAPACELVQAGRDRLWLAGGELAPGEIAPSRLFYPGQTPNFSPALNIQVDRNAEPITAIGFIGDLTIFFRRTSIYILDSDGPDNSFSGIWTQPRKAVGEVGAQDQDSVVTSVVGLWFLSPSGIRRLNNSGAMDVTAGSDIDPIARQANFCSAMVIPQYAQIRWYSRDPSQPSVVYNYQNDAWGTWTGLTAANVVYWPNSTLAVVGRANGELWVETPDFYLDGSSPFEMKVRTSWLHAAQLGDFQRIRRVAVFGNVSIPTGGELLKFTTRFYYDERPFFDEEIIRQIPQTGINGLWNVSTWGGEPTWGTSGPWGDQTVENNSLSFRDNVFRVRERPHRQKCSVISVEFSDQSCVSGRFEPVVVCLELARKPGIDRIPT
jgi:hypothetical protein